MVKYQRRYTKFMKIKIITVPISRVELTQMAHEGFGDFIKAVVDVKQGIMAVGGEFHADEEVVLSEESGSRRENTWGINLYLEKTGDDFIEFDSMVNIKPGLGNMSRNIENASLREKIKGIVKQLIL